jgi:hypothetical protein
MARTFVNRLNRRWKPLERLVSRYKISISKPIFEGRLSPLSLQALKDDGIANHESEIWDIERLMCNSDWAVHRFVREGIEAQHRLERAKEEQITLLLHIRRVCRWAIRQAEVLLQILEERPAVASCAGSSRKWLEQLLFSRLRTVLSMLDRANSFRLEIGEQQQLHTVERRIRMVLAIVQVDGEEDEGGNESSGDGEYKGNADGVGSGGRSGSKNNNEDGGEDESDTEEEMGEVIMRILGEEFREQEADEVEMEL